MLGFDELLLALNELENIVVVSDSEGNIKYVNDAFENKYGYTRDEVIGKNPRILKTDYHDDSFYRDMWKTIKSGDTWEGVFLNKTKSGRLIWEEAKISPIKKNDRINGYIAVKDDITYKKELEEQFHKEKFLLDELFDNAPVGVILFKPVYIDDKVDDLIVIKSNPIAGGVFNRLGLVGLTLKQFLPDFPNAEKKILDMLVEKQNIEHYFVSINKHLNMRTFPLESNQFCMYVHDITMYKNNIIALQESEQRYSTLVEDSPALIRRFNKQGTLSYVNSYYADYLDKTPAQVVGTNLFDLLSNEESILLKERLIDLSITNPNIEYVQKIKLPNGKTQWQKWIDRALTDPFGNIVEYQSVGMDFTKLKETEKSLEEQKNRLNAIFDNSLMGVGVISQNGEFELANSKLKRMLGYDNGETIPTSYFDHVTNISIDIIDDNFKKLFNGELKNFNVQRKFIRTDGTEFWADLFAAPISIKEGKAQEVLGMIVDITQRHKMEEELIASEKQLKQLNNTKDKLFSVIAHDIRNPFNAILGFSTLLEKNIDNFTTKEIKEFARRILEASEQTYKLLEDLLTWAKSQLGQLAIKQEKFSPYYIINDCMGSLKTLAQAKNIELENRIEDHLMMNGDVEMFKFVFRNLMHNSIKFSHPNSQVICGIIPSNDDSIITFFVRDFGVGINPEKQKVLFNLEQFLSTAGTSQEKGTGLGLSLSKEMIELNHGKIEVISEVNKGSEFRITLPIQ